MNTYFKKFGAGWLVTGFLLMLIYVAVNLLSLSAIWSGAVTTAFLTGLVFVLGPFIAGFLGFTRFFAWILGWGVLVLVSGLISTAGEAESLGSPMLLTLPIFLIIGIADEIRYRVKSKSKSKSQ